jgi:hypothetical protein
MRWKNVDLVDGGFWRHPGMSGLVLHGSRGSFVAGTDVVIERA